MPYKDPSMKELIAFTHASIQSAMPGTKPQLTNSKLGALAYSQAALASGLYHKIGYVRNQAVPSLSEDEIFLAHARDAGLIRKPASTSRGTIIARSNQYVTIPKGTELTRNDGELFHVTEEASGNGSFNVSVVSKSAGKHLNMDAGSELMLVTPLFNVDDRFEVVSIHSGADIETIEALRERYVFCMQNPALGGTPSDYVMWMREIPGVSRAWCYRRYYGGSTVGISFVYDERSTDDITKILPSDDEVKDMVDYLYVHKDPVTDRWFGAPAGDEIIYVPIMPFAINMQIRIFPNTQEMQKLVESSLKSAINQVSRPGGAIKRKALTDAISRAGVDDYQLITPTCDELEIEATDMGLLTLGKVTWL